MKYKKLSYILSLIAILSMIAVFIPVVPVMAAGSITVSPTSGAVGTQVNVTGFGFGPTSLQATVIYDGITQTTVPITGGSFGASFYIPAGARGSHAISVTTNGGESAAGSFSIIPVVNLSATTGGVGDQIFVTGNYFNPSTSVNIYFDGINVASAYTDTTGAFNSVGVIVPNTSKGNHSVFGRDNTGDSLSITFTVNSKLNMTPSNPPIGSAAYLSGNGFQGSVTVNFYLDDVIITGVSSATDTTGAFSNVQFTVPVSASGTHVLKAQDSYGNIASVSYSVQQILTVNPQKGTAGTPLTVSGSGFTSNIPINITFNGTAIQTTPSPVNSDAKGTFTATINAPKFPSGTYAIAANDGTNSAQANFTTSPTATMSQSKGAVGSNVTLTGTGFASGAAVTAKFDDISIGAAPGSGSGEFSITFKAPPGRSGDHKVIVTDGTNTFSFTFTLTAAAQISPASGNVGTDISASGNAFASGGGIKVLYDNAQIAQTTADSNGAFSITFKAPASKGGTHIIAVTDGTNTITSNFAMDSTPPPVPVLLAPANNTKADPLAKFQWSGVTDPSGVTYDFQLAQDSGFNSPIINKSGLASPEFQLSEQEALKSTGEDKPYYWRARVVDGASNASNWTTAQTFIVGFIMPVWGWVIIAVAGGIVLFAVGLLLGRRMGRNSF